jgi:hypothetical protein
VETVYTDALRAGDRWRQLQTLAAIGEMGRAGEGLRPEIERLRNASADLDVRERAGWLLTQLADRSR